MSDWNWEKFYEDIRDPAWPDCESLSKFSFLPNWIQKEILYQHKSEEHFVNFFNMLSQEIQQKRVVLLPVSKEYDFLSPKECPNLVRIGSSNDGGYVLPKNLVQECDVLLSGGIDNNWQFEEDWNRLNPKSVIYAYDKTVDNSTVEYQKMWTKRNCNHVAKHLYGLDDALKQIVANKIFVKLDIEGGEYQCIDDIIAYSSIVAGMVIEFHDVNRSDRFVKSIKKLQHHYFIVHLHPNNCDDFPEEFKLPKTLEVTLIRNDYLVNNEIRNPIYLYNTDSPNNHSKWDWFLFFTDRT